MSVRNSTKERPRPKPGRVYYLRSAGLLYPRLSRRVVDGGSAVCSSPRAAGPSAVSGLLAPTRRLHLATGERCGLRPAPEAQGPRAGLTYQSRIGGYLIVLNTPTGYVVSPSSHISESTAPMAVALHVISNSNVCFCIRKSP